MPVVTLQPLNDTDGIDTFIQDGADADTNFGGEANLQLGFRTATNKNARLLFKFDFSSIPAGVSVSSAVLSFYITSTDEAEAGNRTYGAYPITASWAEGTVTWNTEPTVGAVESTTVINANTTGYKDFSIPVMVAGWINGTLTNNGVLIKNATTGQPPHFNLDGSGGTDGQEPKLVINYTPISGLIPDFF